MIWKMPTSTYNQRNEQLCLFYYENIVIVGYPFFKKNSFISLKKVTKFSAQKFLHGKNKDRTVVAHIKDLLGPLEVRPSVGHFGFVRRLGSSRAAMFHAVAFSLSNSYFFRPLVRFL